MAGSGGGDDDKSEGLRGWNGSAVKDAPELRKTADEARTASEGRVAAVVDEDPACGGTVPDGDRGAV